MPANETLVTKSETTVVPWEGHLKVNTTPIPVTVVHPTIVKGATNANKRIQTGFEDGVGGRP